MMLPTEAGGEVAKRNDVSVKVDAAVVEECRLAAVFKGMTLAEYVSETMREASKRDVEEGIARRSQSHPDKPAPGKKGGAR